LLIPEENGIIMLTLNNVLPSNYASDIESLFTSNKINWSFYNDIDFGTQEELPGFVNELYINDKIGKNFDYVFPLLYFLPYTISKIKLLRIKANLLLPSYKKLSPHVDWVHSPNLISAIYYVNTTDGSTEIFAERNDPNELKPEEFTVVKRETPEKNKFLVFDGNHYHRGNYPTKDKRISINFTFIKDFYA